MSAEHPFLKVREYDTDPEPAPSVPDTPPRERRAGIERPLRDPPGLKFAIGGAIAIILGVWLVSFVTMPRQTQVTPPAMSAALNAKPLRLEPTLLPVRPNIAKLAPIALVPVVDRRAEKPRVSPHHASSAPHAPADAGDAGDAVFGAPVLRYVQPEAPTAPLAQTALPAQSQSQTQTAQSAQTAPALTAEQQAEPSGYQVASIVGKDLVLIGSRQHGKLLIVPHHAGDRLPDGSTIIQIDAAHGRVLTSAGPLGSL